MDNFGVMNSMFTIGSNHSDSDYLGPSASQIGGSGPGSSSSSSTLPGSSASHSRRDLLDSVSRRATASILDDTIHRRILEDIDKACNEAIEQHQRGDEPRDGSDAMRRHYSYQNGLNSKFDVYHFDNDLLGPADTDDRFNASMDSGGPQHHSRSYSARHLGKGYGSYDRSVTPDFTRSRQLSPPKGYHDIKLNGYHDADSGIRSISSPSADLMSKDLQTSIMDDYMGGSPMRSPGSLNRCFVSVPDLQNALHDSEDRRQLLMDKLKEAHDTIKYQARQMNHIESSSRNSSLEIDTLRSRSKDFERKLDALQKERRGYHDKQLEHLSKREDLQKRLDEQESEIRILRSDKEMLQTDIKRKQETIDQTMIAMNILEEENTKLLKDLKSLVPQSSRSFQAKDNIQRELAALKESLEITRARNKFLEENRKDGSHELVSLREENKSLTKKTSDLMIQNQKLTATNIALKEENKSLVNNVQSTNKEKSDLLDRMASLTTSLGEMKATATSNAIDKDRYFREGVDLRTQIHGLEQDKEKLYRTKCAAEERVTELNAEWAKCQLEKDRLMEDLRKKDDELDAVKKVGEVLSMEISCVKTKLEKLTEQNQGLEQAKVISSRQHQLYEQEIKSLESQLEAAKKSLESSKNERLRDQDGRVQQLIKCKEELRQTKAERNSLEAKLSDLESKYKQASAMLKEQQGMQVKETEVWKTNCESMTNSVSRKEMEIQTLNKRIQELEDQVDHLKVNHETHQNQYQELVECRQEITRLEEEKRRSEQEKAENQQLIQLLEMQKNILTKTSADQMTRAQDMEKYQAQVEQMLRDKRTLEEKIRDLERTRTALLKEKDLSCSLAASMETKGSRMREMEHQIEHLQNRLSAAMDQIHALEKENKSYKSREDSMASRSEKEMLEREKTSLEENYQHLKSQFNDLESRYHKVLTDKGSLFSGDSCDGGKLQAEKQSLESELAMLQSRLLVAENSKKRSEDQVKELQSRVEELLTTHLESGDDATAVLKSQVKHLEKELEKSKDAQVKLEMQMQSMKDQSLDDVGADLSQMRMELQKLMEVIQEKDAAIESLEQQLKQEADGRDDNDGKMVARSTTRPRAESCGSRLIEDLESELDKVTAERNTIRRELIELQSSTEEMEKKFVEEKERLEEKMKREMRAKDRQIESLEEQLRRSTKVELKKLKRDAGKVDLLKAENRRLQSQLGSFSHGNDSTESSDFPSSNGLHKLTAAANHWGSSYDFLDSDTSSVDGDLIDEAMGDVITSADKHMWCKRGSTPRLDDLDKVSWNRSSALTETLNSPRNGAVSGRASPALQGKLFKWSSHGDVRANDR